MINTKIIVTLIPVIIEQLTNLQRIVAILGQDDVTEEQVGEIIAQTDQLTNRMEAAVNRLKPKVDD